MHMAMVAHYILVWMITLIKASIQRRSCRPAHPKARESNAIITAGVTPAVQQATSHQQPERSKGTKMRRSDLSYSSLLMEQERRAPRRASCAPCKPNALCKRCLGVNPSQPALPIPPP